MGSLFQGGKLFKKDIKREHVLEEMERVLHKWCVNNAAKDYNIPAEAFRVILSTTLKNDVVITNGPVKLIHLRWPHIKERGARDVLYRVMRYIANTNMLSSFVSDTAHTLDVSSRVWRRYPYDDIAEHDSGVLPTHEFRTSVKKSVTLTHKLTGMSHTVIDNSGTRSEWDMLQQCRVELSRIIHGRMTDEVTVIDENVENVENIENKCTALVPYALHVDTALLVAALKTSAGA